MRAGAYHSGCSGISLAGTCSMSPLSATSLATDVWNAERNPSMALPWVRSSGGTGEVKRPASLRFQPEAALISLGGAGLRYDASDMSNAAQKWRRARGRPTPTPTPTPTPNPDPDPDPSPNPNLTLISGASPSCSARYRSSPTSRSATPTGRSGTTCRTPQGPSRCATSPGRTSSRTARLESGLACWTAAAASRCRGGGSGITRHATIPSGWAASR